MSKEITEGIITKVVDTLAKQSPSQDRETFMTLEVAESIFESSDEFYTTIGKLICKEAPAQLLISNSKGFTFIGEEDE